MAKTYYEALGVGPRSMAAEIRSAYRKLVLLHHPDRSSDSESKAIFLAATEAYETLSDPERRAAYDAYLAAPRPRPNPAPPMQKSPSAQMAEMKLDVNRLVMLFNRGAYAESETLAQSILARDPKQAVAYGVLGDLARGRGRIQEAMKMYASAMRADPHSATYRQRYEELSGRPVVRRSAPIQTVADERATMFAPLFGLGLVMLACLYVYFSREPPLLPDIGLISTWTMGLVVMLFLSGVAVGATHAMEGQPPRTNPLGRIGPAMALGSVAVVSLWVALLLYVGMALRRRTFHSATSRLMASAIAASCMMALFAEAAGHISGLEVFLWGGNLIYLGALAGWSATDAVRTMEE